MARSKNNAFVTLFQKKSSNDEFDTFLAKTQTAKSQEEQESGKHCIMQF